MLYHSPGVCCASELLDLCKHQLWSKAFREAHAGQYWTVAGVFPELEAKQHAKPVWDLLLVVRRLQALSMCETHFDATVTRLLTVLPGLKVQYCCLLQPHLLSVLTPALTCVVERVWYVQH